MSNVPPHTAIWKEDFSIIKVGFVELHFKAPPSTDPSYRSNWYSNRHKRGKFQKNISISKTIGKTTFNNAVTITFSMIYACLDEWAHTLHCAPDVLFHSSAKDYQHSAAFLFSIIVVPPTRTIRSLHQSGHFAKHDPCLLYDGLVSRGGLNSSHTTSLMWTLSQVSLDTASAAALLGAKRALLWMTKGRARQQLVRLCQGLERC